MTPGRVAAPRDAGATRRKLLAAARREFAAFGIDGARIDRIAAQAGVNKERVYGHFGSKDALFAAVLAAALQELSESVAHPGQDLEAWVEAVYDFDHKRSEVVSLIMWEALRSRNDDLPGEMQRREAHLVKVATLAEVLDCPAGPEVAAILLCLIGLAAWPSAVPQPTRPVVSESAASRPERDRIRREQIIGFARYVANSAPPSRDDSRVLR